MSDRPTPETDAAVKRFFKRTYTGACVCVDADDMRRLERQRDAAVEALKEIAEWRMHSGALEYQKCQDYGDEYYLIESEVNKAREKTRAVLREIEGES